MARHRRVDFGEAPDGPSRVRRRALYVLLAVAGALAVVELGARAIEALLLPVERTIPLPAPHSPGGFEFTSLSRQARIRAGMPDHPQIPMIEDPKVGWALSPSARLQADREYGTNSLGLRGPDLGTLAPGDMRLMSLGDSSVFGVLVEREHVLSTVAAKALSRAWGRNVEGVIGAVPGHDSTQSLAMLRKVGPQVRPAWVVVGNLWSDVYRADAAKDIRDDLVFLPPVRDRFRMFATYRILRRALTPWLAARKIAFMASGSDVADDAEGTRARVPLKQYIENLRAMNKAAGGLGARVAYLTLAAPMDFDSVPPPVAVQEYRAAMRRVAEESGAPLVDGPAVFKAAGAHIGWFFDPVHPTHEGHELLGTEIAAAIAKAGPPPEGKSSYDPR